VRKSEAHDDVAYELNSADENVTRTVIPGRGRLRYDAYASEKSQNCRPYRNEPDGPAEIAARSSIRVVHSALACRRRSTWIR
jgi:hypothetical protein